MCKHLPISFILLVSAKNSPLKKWIKQVGMWPFKIVGSKHEWLYKAEAINKWGKKVFTNLLECFFIIYLNEMVFRFITTLEYAKLANLSVTFKVLTYHLIGLNKLSNEP